MLRRIVTIGVVGLSLALIGGAAWALTLTLTPIGGPPGSTFTADVLCEAPPEVYVRTLDAGAPLATLVPLEGAEPEPGRWTFDLAARERDQVVIAVCDDERAVSRYDVEHPVLIPGPTWSSYGDWRWEEERTTVVGTDCTEAAAGVLIRADGAVWTSGAATDSYGDWEVTIPAVIPAGPVTVSAECGDLTYDDITFERQVPPGGQPPGPTTPTAPVPQCLPDGSIPPGAESCVSASDPQLPGPAPAQPITARPQFTG